MSGTASNHPGPLAPLSSLAQVGHTILIGPAAGLNAHARSSDPGSHEPLSTFLGAPFSS